MGFYSSVKNGLARGYESCKAVVVPFVQTCKTAVVTGLVGGAVVVGTLFGAPAAHAVDPTPTPVSFEIPPLFADGQGFDTVVTGMWANARNGVISVIAVIALLTIAGLVIAWLRKTKRG